MTDKHYLPYQLAFIDYAMGARGTLLADEMGLGKTVEAIGLINRMKAKRVLIVSPSCLKLNWRNELTEWLEPNPNQEIHLVTYHQAELHSDVIENADLHWDLLIVDEAHYIKNPQSKRSRIITNVSKNAKRVVLITGTPMDGRPISLWPLLRIVAPDEFDPKTNSASYVISAQHKKSHPGEGPNFWAFAKRYCGLKISGIRHKAFDFSGATRLDELNARLKKSCMVRRLKKDVLTQLPPKRRQVIVLEGQRLYEDLLPELNEQNYEQQVARLFTNRIIFEKYAKQRHEQALEKIDACLEIIEEALESKYKLIVFAHHGDVIEKLRQGISAALYSSELGAEYCVVATGKVHVADRAAAVYKFQNDPKCRVFLGSIGAAGVGITLTAASHVIFVELDPSPERMTQAEDRAHRIGQNDMVLVQHLVYDGSLCAKIAKILVKKQAANHKVLDG